LNSRAKAPPTDAFGHRFADAELLTRALTHRSAGSRNYERLEFLGDALVNLIVAEALFTRLPRADEGMLTRARAALVRESSLAAIARELGLGDHLQLGPGELKSGGFRRESILADALEGLVAAVYLDAGFDACRALVLQWFDGALDEAPERMRDKDPKTRLQEWLQAGRFPLPAYELLDTEGEDHCKTFHVRCAISDPPLECTGSGSSRREAEQAAAAAALQQLLEKP
jgi:ribonuclease III